MWSGTGTTIQMTEGDFGVALPITVKGITMNSGDGMKLTVKKSKDGDELFSHMMEVSEPTENPVFNLSISEAESAQLQPGRYVYILDWYRDGAFLCNILPGSTLKVVNKA